MNLNKIKCDRCGIVVDEVDSKTIRYVTGFMESSHYADLCRDCNKKLSKWMNNK